MRKRSKKGWRLLLAEYSRASESTDAQNVYVHYSPVIDDKIVKSRRDCAAKNTCGYTAQEVPFPTVHQEYACQGS
jgi:hypothetical protein